MKEFGATAATTLRLTYPWIGSGRIVGDSLFSSVNAAMQLMNINGLQSILLVKTTHKKYPKIILHEKFLERGQRNLTSGKVDGVNLQAVLFKDLQEK